MGREGWRLLPDYVFEATTGIWRHRDARLESNFSLKDLQYPEGRPAILTRHATEPDDALDGYLEHARRILGTERGTESTADASRTTTPRLDGDEEERLRWFPLPGDSASAGEGDDGPSAPASG